MREDHQVQPDSTEKYPAVSVRKSDAAKSALLSAVVIPGAGQIYNRQWAKGLFIAIVFLVSSLSVLIPITYAFSNYFIAIGSDAPEKGFQSFLLLNDLMWQLITLAFISIVLYIYSIVDAYKTQIRRNKNKGNSKTNTAIHQNGESNHE